MAKKPPKDPGDIAEALTADLMQVLSTDLVSVCMFGSAAGERYRQGHSDINLLVVVDDESDAKPSLLIDFCRRWAPARVAPPLWVTPGYLDRSRDVFPMEMLAMAAEHRVIYGEDPLAGLSVEPKYVRLQLEREIKAKLAAVRGGLLASGGKAGPLTDMARRALPAIIAICRAWLFLRGQEAPEKPSQILAAAGKAGLEVAAAAELHRVRDGHSKRRPEGLIDMWDRVAAELEHNGRLVDGLEV